MLNVVVTLEKKTATNIGKQVKWDKFQWSFIVSA